MLPVALLNEIVLMTVGFILGYKFQRRRYQIRDFFNKFRRTHE